MQKTIQIKLLPTKEQRQLITDTMQEYIKTVNYIVADMVLFNEFGKLSSSNTQANLPSTVKNQCILDSKSIFKKYHKTKIQAILKKPMSLWNNQNFKITETTISFPVLVDGKNKRLKVQVCIPSDILEQLQNYKLGTLRITCKSDKLIAQIAIEVKELQPVGTNTMGVDLGLKCPAVCSTDDNKVLFVGNRRKNKYIRRHFKTKRKKLGKSKKVNAIKKLNNKEQRIMKDIDHKLSRQIVNFAVKNNVTTINMEQLSNIRKTAKTSRKNAYNPHSWPFYRLAQYIEYKSKIYGITVSYVNPAYTSQTCPNCGTRNKATDRLYNCKCGYSKHRDLVGAINILSAPMISGKSLSA